MMSARRPRAARNAAGDVSHLRMSVVTWAIVSAVAGHVILRIGVEVREEGVAFIKLRLCMTPEVDAQKRKPSAPCRYVCHASTLASSGGYSYEEKEEHASDRSYCHQRRAKRCAPFTLHHSPFSLPSARPLPHHHLRWLTAEGEAAILHRIRRIVVARVLRRLS